MKDAYYLLIDDEKKGPLSLAELKQRILAGDITEETLVWTEETGQPVPVNTLISCSYIGIPSTHSRPAHIADVCFKGSQIRLEDPERDIIYHPFNLKTGFLSVIFNFFNIRSRATRSEFWCYVTGLFLSAIAIFALLVMLVIYDLFFVHSDFFSVLVKVHQDYLLQLYMVVMIPILLPFVRRLHDIGLSDWFVLLFLLDYIVPPFGTLAIFIMACIDSKPGENCQGKFEKYHYYYFIDDKKMGPFSITNIHQRILAGVITKETLIWTEETGQPVPFKQLSTYLDKIRPEDPERDIIYHPFNLKTGFLSVFFNFFNIRSRATRSEFWG